MNASSQAGRQPTILQRLVSPQAAALYAALLSLVLFVATAQWQINGSESPYATDVGELQNALPRWGTIHFTGYPLYSFIGSAFVSLLRLLAIQPAAGASLYSAVWGALTIWLLVRLMQDVGIAPPLAALASLLYAVSQSFWVDASLAEVHTMTMALTVASLWLALRFGRSGDHRELVWLTIVASQGVAHQRALAFVAPALLLLVWPKLPIILQRILPLIGWAALAPLTYLYLPIRDWMGCDWTFGQPGTWHGFWAMILDTKSERIIDLPTALSEWWLRLRQVIGLLADELSLALLALALIGLLCALIWRNRRETIAWILVGTAYVALSLIIWEGRLSDALLAVQLPSAMIACLGIALGAQQLLDTGSLGRVFTPLLLSLLVVLIGYQHRPVVLSITRDDTTQATIERAAALADRSDRPTTLLALWGHDYWALRYAQSYQGRFAELHLVDHNADLAERVAAGQRVTTLEKTLYQRPLDWWEDAMGPLRLASPSAGIIEMLPAGQADATCGLPMLALENGISICDASLAIEPTSELALTLNWLADTPPDCDYAVAVHLLAANPPSGPEDILAQADRSHPVGGWYPTSRWSAGECVPDSYPLPQANGAIGVRVAMYRALSDGSFENSEWLYLPLP